MALSQYQQWFTENMMGRIGEKTKPIKALQRQPLSGILSNKDNREKPLIALLPKKIRAGGKRK
jgi:hypothetical protein